MRGIFDDWHAQGLYLLGNCALSAGVTNYVGCLRLSGFCLGMCALLYVTILARVRGEREYLKALDDRPLPSVMAVSSEYARPRK